MALVLSLILIMVVSGLCVGFVRTAASVAGTQHAASDQMKAFYLSEAGLSEAFHAVRMGRSGRIGTESNWASYGDGLVWVQAAETEDSRVWLRSTAIVGGGKAVLGLIIDPEDPPLGFFADEDLVIESAVLLDGFDSTQRSYEQEVAASQVEEPPPPLQLDGIYIEDPSSPYYQAQINANYFVDQMSWFGFTLSNQLVVTESTNAEGQIEPGWYIISTPFDVEARLSSPDWDRFVSQALDMKLAYDAGAINLSSTASELDLLRDSATTNYAAPTDPLLYSYTMSVGDGETERVLIGEPAGPSFEVHTERGGMLGSNGNIDFVGEAADSKVYGSVVPGVDGEVLGLDEASVTGSTDSRALPVELAPVIVPDVASSGNLDHTGAIPQVLSPGTRGIGDFSVSNGSEVVIRGPATLVVENLTLDDGSTLVLDTRDGDVELFVTGSLTMDPASFVETTGASASEVSIQAAATDGSSIGPELVLDAVSAFRGTVYAPDSTVHIGKNFEVFGGVISRRLEIASGAALHFDDESFNGTLAVPEQDSWKILDLPTPSARPTRRTDDTNGAPANHPAISEAHDLDNVSLSVRYVDASGAEQHYAGPEDQFDWTNVASVTAQQRRVDRATVTESNSPGEVSGASDAPNSIVEDFSDPRQDAIDALVDWLEAQGLEVTVHGEPDDE